MIARVRTTSVLVTVGVLAAAGLFVAGRATVDSHAARQHGYQSGYATGHYDGYFDGLQAGETQGRQDGRALQEGQELPAADRQVAADAFNDGYAAGTNDVFAGYDGGWQLSIPYVVNIEQGTGKVDYRIASREAM